MITETDKVLIVLVPAYQPREALVESTNQLLSTGYTVVVVDDGSGTKCQDIFSGLDNRIHLLHHSINRGKGAALKTGFEYIQNTFENYVIVTADADGQHAVSDIAKIATSYELHPHSLVLGSRTFTENSVPLKSKFGNVLTRKVFSLITHQRLSDTQTGLRAFDDSLTNFMLNVLGDRYEYEMNVLLECSREGIKIVEVPIQTIYEKNNEGSHFDPVKDSLAIYGQIIKFASSSLTAFGIDYAMYLLLLHLTSSWTLATSVVVSNVIARLVSATFNFSANKRLVFRHSGDLAKSITSYALLAAGILATNTMLLAVLTSAFAVTPALAKVLTEIVLFFASYAVQKNVIFTQKKESNDEENHCDHLLDRLARG